MKKTLIAIIAVLVIVSIAVTVINVSADDATVAGGDSAFGVMESFTESETAEEISTKIEESFEETDTGIDAGELNQAISNSQSKTEAIINIADMFGIPVSDAEALVNTLVALGDERFEDSDTWLIIRNNIIEHPDLWTIIAIVSLGFLALVAFLIRCLIRNALTQTNTKLKLNDLDKHGKEVDGKLEVVDADNKEIISLLGGIKELLEGESAEIKRENEDLKARMEVIREAIADESAAVDSLKANSETSLNVAEESALQILQLLNIAMNRKVPTVSEGARKVWYDDAVAKVKAKAGISDGGEKTE